MAKEYFPFDSGAGGATMENQWTKMAKHWLGTGILHEDNELEVYADSTGMQVKVKSGVAWIKGHYFHSDAEETLPIDPADVTNPRIDRVIVRLDWITNIIELAVLTGVPAVSPVAPALTQNSSRWEISLAQISVGAGVATIAPEAVTCERFFVMSEARTSLRVYKGSVDQAITTSQYNKIVLNNTLHDALNEWDKVNSKWICPRDGVYLIGGYFEEINGGTILLGVYISGSYINCGLASGASARVFGATSAKLKKGDIVECHIYAYASGGSILAGTQKSWFFIEQLG